MSNIKYRISATPEQIERLKKALHVGSPLDVALKFSGIAKSTYYYWVAIASVVKFVKEQEFAKNEDNNVKSGISFAAIKESVQQQNAMNKNARATIDAFVEPGPEAILRYKNNSTYRKFADEIYSIIEECDKLRSEIVLYHLTAIRDSAKQRGNNSNSSQWFLERTMPEYFGRPYVTDDENPTNKTVTAPVTVKFISPDNKDSVDRVKDMERLVEVQLGVSNDNDTKA